MSKLLSKTGYILICLLSLSIIAVSIFFLYKTVEFDKNCVQVNGIVVDVHDVVYRSGNVTRTHKDVIVDYMYDGEWYTGIYNKYDHTTYEGATVPVLVNPDNPLSFRYPEETYLQMLTLFGIVVLFCGVLICSLFQIFRDLIPSKAERERNRIMKYL